MSWQKGYHATRSLSGSGFTFTYFTEAQPPGSVYDIMSSPELTGETMPDELIVAMDGKSLLHDPPLVASDRVIVPPVYTLAGPEIAAGTELIVTVAVV